MSSTSTTTGPPDPGGLLGTLRSWMRAWSHEDGPAPADLLAEAAVPDSHRPGSVRVLVVDDNPLNLMEMSEQLESRGLVALLAADGAEAVALACEMHFDLILMDLQMPILDGLEATAAIRRFERTGSRPAVPVVAYSSVFPGAAILADFGMNGSLFKPCEHQDLEDCLVQWCPTYHSAPNGKVRSMLAANRSPGSRSASPR